MGVGEHVVWYWVGTVYSTAKLRRSGEGRKKKRNETKQKRKEAGTMGESQRWDSIRADRMDAA